MTDSDIIAAIGTANLARTMGKSPSLVSHWKRRGIPYRWRAAVLNIMASSHPDPEAFVQGEGRP